MQQLPEKFRQPKCFEVAVKWLSDRTRPQRARGLGYQRALSLTHTHVYVRVYVKLLSETIHAADAEYAPHAKTPHIVEATQPMESQQPSPRPNETGQEEVFLAIQ